MFKNKSNDTDNEASINAKSRFFASGITWPVEKSKLLYQGGVPARKLLPIFSSLSFSHQITGIASSCIQRGVSAWIMFDLQRRIKSSTDKVTPFPVINDGIAGALAGTISAPFHTFWELLKVTGRIFTIQSYFVALKPMLFRHGVFDMSFFATTKYFENESSSVKFALAAAFASFSNLLFDVWKTQQMEQFPKRVDFKSVLKELASRRYGSNYLMKGTDLSVNWFVVGIIKDHFFSNVDELV
jgi:hypothetical protein